MVKYLYILKWRELNADNPRVLEFGVKKAGIYLRELKEKTKDPGCIFLGQQIVDIRKYGKIGDEVYTYFFFDWERMKVMWSISKNFDDVKKSQEEYIKKYPKNEEQINLFCLLYKIS